MRGQIMTPKCKFGAFWKWPTIAVLNCSSHVTFTMMIQIILFLCTIITFVVLMLDTLYLNTSGTFRNHDTMLYLASNRTCNELGNSTVAIAVFMQVL